MTRPAFSAAPSLKFAVLLVILSFVVPIAAPAQDAGRGTHWAPLVPQDPVGTVHGASGHESHEAKSTVVPAATGGISFLPYMTYTTDGYNPYTLAVADVNGDGKPDLIIVNEGTNSGDGSVGVLLGNGDGTFQSPVSYDSGGGYGYAVFVADVNGDGKPDIITGNGCAKGTSCSPEGSVGVLLGNGDGTFQPAVSYSTGGYSLYGSSVAVADLRGKGKMDIVVANDNASTVGVLLGKGDGTFAAAVTYSSTGDGATSVAVADVNGDGKPDLVVTNFCPSSGCGTSYPYPNGVVAVLLGNGDGTFQNAVAYGAGGASSYGVALADVNGDGKTDILTANCGPESCAPYSYGGTVGVLLGNGDGTFQAATSYGAGNSPFAISVADTNGDGFPDAVVGNWGVAFGADGNYDLTILLGNGDGTFQPPITFLTGGGYSDSVAVADFNGDGKPDVAVTTYGGNGTGTPPGIVSVLLNNTAAATATGLSSSPNPSYYAQSVTLIATVTSNNGTPTGTVIFYNGSTQIGSAALSGGSASVSTSSLPTGSDPITAAYQGSGSFAGSTSPVLTQVVNGTVSTTTTLSSFPNPSTYGQTVGFVAQVTSGSGTPTGTVQLLLGSTVVGTGTLSNGLAYINVSTLPLGSDSMTAAYQGSANFGASTSSVLIQQVATPTTAYIDPVGSADLNQPVTFTAVVSSSAGTPTGTVIFNIHAPKENTYQVPATLNAGAATYTTSFVRPGNGGAFATYQGNATFGTSSSVAIGFRVYDRYATSTTIASSHNPSSYGQTVTFTATVSSSHGAIPDGEMVKFKVGRKEIGTAPMTDGVAVLTTSTLAAGTYPVEATYSGDRTFGGSSAAVTQTVTAYTTTTTITSSLNPSSYGQTVTWTATVTSSGPITPTGQIKFTGINWSAKLSGGVATVNKTWLNAATYPITAEYEGDSGNTASSSSVLNQVINPASTTTALTSSSNPSTQGQPVTFTATVTSSTGANATGTVTFTAGTTTLGTVSLTGVVASISTSTLPAGSSSVTATYNGVTDFTGSSASLTQTVN